MPIVLDDEEYVPASPGFSIGDFNEATSAQADHAARRSVGGGNSFGGALGGLAFGATAGLLDTVASSLTLGGIKKGTIDGGLVHALGVPGLNQWYADNAGARDVGTAVAGVIASSYAAGKFLNPAGKAMQFLGKSSYGARIATLDAQYETAKRGLMATEIWSARSGALGLEQTVGKMVLPSGTATTRNAAAWGFRSAAIKRGLAQNVVTEGIMTATLNQNDLLYGGDVGDQIMFAGLGLIGGAAIDLAQSQWAVRKMANSDVIKRINSNSFDPYGTEDARLSTVLGDMQASHLDSFGYSGGRHSDLATSYAISAAESGNPLATKSRNLFSSRDALSTQMEVSVRDEVQKLTVRGIDVVPGSGFSMSGNSHPAAVSVSNAVHRDPAALFGVESLGIRNGDMTFEKLAKERQTKIDAGLDEVSKALNDGGVMVDSTRKDPKTGQITKTKKLRPFKPEEAEAYRAKYRQLVFANSQVEMHLVNGEWVPPSVGKLFDKTQPVKILREGDGDLKIWQAADRQAGNQLGVDSHGNIFTPGNLNPEDLQFEDSMALFHIADQAADFHVKSGERFQLPQEPNWFQLDLAEEILKRGKDDNLVQWPLGFTRENAMAKSFQEKLAIIKGKHGNNASIDEIHKLRYQMNLPRLTSYEAGLLGTTEHPWEVVLRGMANRTEIDSLSYEEIVKAMDDAGRINGFTGHVKDRADKTTGNMFSFMLDKPGGKFMEPVIGFKRQTAPFEWIKDDLAERIAMAKTHMVAKLTGNDSPLLRELSAAIVGDADSQLISQIDSLRDAQLDSALPGFSTRGIGGDLISKEWRDRDIPTLQAAARLQDKVSRRVRAHMEERIRTVMGDVNSLINGPRNGTSKFLANQFGSFRQGWDLAARKNRFVSDSNGLIGFRLDPESVANQRRWKAMFGTDMPADPRLVGPKGQEIKLDRMALDWWTKFDSIAAEIRATKNVMNDAKGLGKIGHVDFYTPPPNTRGKYIGFTLNEFGEPVPYGTIVASTQDEFTALRNALHDPNNPLSPLRGSGNHFYTQDQIEDFNTVWDKAQQMMYDPSVTPLQPNRRSKGLLAGPEVNPNGLVDAMTWARDSYLNVGNDLIGNMFADTIRAAKSRAQISRPMKRNMLSRAANVPERGIYDFFLENLMGKENINAEGSVVGRFYRGAERVIDPMLEKASGRLHAALNYVKNRIPKNGSDAEFDKLVTALGKDMPFATASEYAEKIKGAPRPASLGQITGAMSRFEAAMRLRMFEMIHPVLNLSGVVNAMPSVIRAMQQLPGENEAEYFNRIGHIGTHFNLDGKQISIPDMGKLMAGSIREAWDIKNHAHYDRWQSLGYVTQEAAEFNRQMGVMNTRDWWVAKKWLGDPNAKSEIGRKGFVGMTSVLSDRSEDLSRAMAHVTGFNLGKKLGIEDTQALDSFAHDFANKAIANYNPLNRAGVFQGAVGAPIGLFQSFSINFYQRMFRYMETGDKVAFATQLATQSALFGVHTIPGFDQISDIFFQADDGESDPTTGVYGKFGQEMGDFIFGGTLSNLPKLLNLIPGVDDVQGIDLYSRGDLNVRLPVFNGIPAADTFMKIKGAIEAGFSAFSSDNPQLTGTQLAEIVSNGLGNRPMAGFIEQFGANGFDTDKFGQVASEAKMTGESTYRVLGTRSLRQAKELEAFYANKGAQEIQGAMQDDLRMSLRSAIRSGNPIDFEGYMAKYIENGGDPRKFNQYLRQNTEAALKSRGERMFRTLEKSGRHPELLQRLIDMGVSIEESENSSGKNPYAGDQEPDISQPEGTKIAPGFENPAAIDEGYAAQEADPNYLNKM